MYGRLFANNIVDGIAIGAVVVIVAVVIVVLVVAVVK